MEFRILPQHIDISPAIESPKTDAVENNAPVAFFGGVTASPQGSTVSEGKGYSADKYAYFGPGVLETPHKHTAEFETFISSASCCRLS